MPVACAQHSMNESRIKDQIAPMEASAPVAPLWLTSA